MLAIHEPSEGGSGFRSPCNFLSCIFLGGGIFSFYQISQGAHDLQTVTKHCTTQRYSSSVCDHEVLLGMGVHPANF